VSASQPARTTRAVSRRIDVAAARDAAGLARELGDALSDGEVATAEGVVRRAIDAGLPGPLIHSRIIAPAMYEVGRRWEHCGLSVADEHLATAACHQLLALVYEHLLVARPRSRSRALLAGVEGELHALGLRMAADVLEGGGYDVAYLGVDVPRDALIDAVTRFQPVLVGLTATSAETAQATVAVIARLRSLDPELAIVAGGQGFIGPGQAGLGVEIEHDVEGLLEAVERLAPVRAVAPSRPRRNTDVTIPVRATRPSHEAQFEATTASLAALTRRHATNAYGLRLEAMQDALTGLWNRRAFDDRIRELIADPAAQPLALLLIDLDSFKAINDDYGHQAGDAALQKVAVAMRGAVRADDFVARLGGDEFVVLVPHATPADAAELAERIRATIAAESSPHFTVSIGIKECSGDPRASMLAADIGLYRAKSRGRDTIFVSA